MGLTKFEQIEFTWSLDIKEVSIVKLLGSGGFGSVYEATYKNTKVALKQLHTNCKNKKAAMQSFKAETRHEVLSLMDHPNIVKTLAVSNASTLDDKPCFIMEFVSTETLQHQLNKSPEKFTDQMRINIASQIAQALVYVHQHGVVHLDLKPVNILMTIDGDCKLADFGCCQYIEDRPNTPSRSYVTGTIVYRAPELLKGEDPTYKADVYSFAICLWQLWTGETPYANIGNHQSIIFRVVACNLRPKIPEGLDNRFVDLITSSWAAKANDRPSMDTVAKILSGWVEKKEY